MTFEEAEQVYNDHFDGKPVDPELMAQARAFVADLNQQIALRFIREIEWVWCNDHGRTYVELYGTSTGFTGAPIFWMLLACGCAGMDDSMDTLEWVR